MQSKVDEKGTTNYEYDELSRLKVVTEPKGKTTTYSYNKAGNRATETAKVGGNTIVKKYSYNSQNRLDSVITELNGIIVDRTTYVYDNKGNQLSSTSIAYVDGKEQAPTQTVNRYEYCC